MGENVVESMAGSMRVLRRMDVKMGAGQRRTGAAVSAVDPSDSGTMQASSCGNEEAAGMASMDAQTKAAPPTMASSLPKRSDTMAIG